MIHDPTTTFDLALAAHRDRLSAAVRHRVAATAGGHDRSRRTTFWTARRSDRQP